MRKHEEDDHQSALFTWAAMKPFRGGMLSDFLFAIPNGGRRNPREAARMKGQGVKAGVSDIHLPVPMGEFAGLWIELKAPKGKATALQIDWLNRMASCGHAAFVCHGWEAAKKTITDYINQGEIK